MPRRSGPAAHSASNTAERQRLQPHPLSLSLPVLRRRRPDWRLLPAADSRVSAKKALLSAASLSIETGAPSPTPSSTWIWTRMLAR